MIDDDQEEQGPSEAQLALLLERKRAYQLAFKSPAGEAVMKDLTRYCFVKSTTRGEPLAEGRRQVYLRIQAHLELDVPQLYTHFVEIGGEHNG